MKREDIDKKIGMPDVDAEWAKFEREVINPKTASRKPLYWGIGVAASVALALGIFLLNHNAEEQQQPIAQKTTHTTEMPSADNKTVDAVDEPVTLPEKDEPAKIETKQRPSTELLAQVTPTSAEEELMGRIAGLTIVSSSDDLGPNTMRRADCPNTQEEKRDSVLVVVNGQPIMKEEKIDDLHQYFFDRHQLVDSIRVMRDETYRAIYGEQGKNSQVIVKIYTTPFTPVSQLTPDQLKERRLVYLLDSYRKGFTENTNRECFTPDLYDTPMEERLFGMLTQQYGRLRREYFGPVGSDTHGVYVPLIREAVMVANDPAWMDGSGKIITNENSPQLNQVLSEIDQAASQADKHIQRTDSFVRKAFIYGGTVAEGEPRTLYSNIWRFAPRGLWESTFHFVPNPDAPSFWCGEVYSSTSGQRHVIMHLHSVDKLYAADCPEILNNRRRIAGTVLNEQDKPLADIIVSMVGSAPTPETVQVRSDRTGHFELWLPFPDATIEVGHVGYMTTRLLHPADTTLAIRMKDATTKLREVKVLPKEKIENY